MVSAHMPENIGRVLRVTRFVGAVPRYAGKDRWEFEGAPLVAGWVATGERSGDGATTVRDCRLRPIRPDEGQDETLRWAGKPMETTVTEIQKLMDEFSKAVEEI